MNKLFLILMTVLMGLTMSGCGGLAPVNNYVLGDSARKGEVVEVIDIWIDDSFNETELKSIMESVKEWKKVFNGQVKLEIGGKLAGKALGRKLYEISRSRSGWVILKLDSEDSQIKDIITEGTLAFTDKVGGNIMVVVEDRIGNRDLGIIMMHEMGHLMGAEHVKIKGNLMYPGYGRIKRCVDKITVMQVGEHKDIDMSRLNYCGDK